MLCECFRSRGQTAGELADGGFQGGAAGHWVLAVTTHCRSQALENVWVLQAPGAGESCVCCRTLLNGHPRTSKQNHFPPCNASLAPSTGKASVRVGKGKDI